MKTYELLFFLTLILFIFIKMYKGIKTYKKVLVIHYITWLDI